jgi:hypothetical protein
MSSYNPTAHSLTGQGPPVGSTLEPDGSTAPTSGSDILAASDGTAAPDHILLDEKIIQFGANGEYIVDLDLKYIKDQGCQWTVALQRTSALTGHRYVDKIVTTGLFLNPYDIQQRWRHVEITQNSWNLLRELLWDENAEISENKPYYIKHIDGAIDGAVSFPTGEQVCKEFDQLFKEHLPAEQRRQSIAYQLEAICTD